MSGYTPCACRDCPDTTMSNDTSKPELCEACREAGCLARGQFDGRYYSSPGAYDCQRDDAYGEC